jgi:putative acetyltransferase
MRLRAEQDTDHDAVRDLHHRASGSHGPVVAAVVQSLRAILVKHPGASLVAESGGRVVGHVMFTRALLDAPSRLVEVQVLSPLAVLPEHQGQGIGTALIRRGLELMKALPTPLVFLEGPPDYYRRAGFTAAGELGFRKPSLRIPEPAFQVCLLPGYEPWMTGTLVYPSAFWEHDAVGLRDSDTEAAAAAAVRS